MMPNPDEEGPDWRPGPRMAEWAGNIYRDMLKIGVRLEEVQIKREALELDKEEARKGKLADEDVIGMFLKFCRAKASIPQSEIDDLENQYRAREVGVDE
jgi:hypothetical protein